MLMPTSAMGGGGGSLRITCIILSIIACAVAGLVTQVGTSPAGIGTAWLGNVRQGSPEEGGTPDERPAAVDSGAHDDLLQFLATSSFGRRTIVDLLIREWVGEDPPEETRADKLDDALEAIGIMESDGEPVGVTGYPYLFVGSVGAAMNEEALHRNGITHVVSWSPTARCDVFSSVHYLCVHDVLNARDMLRHLDELDRAVDFVENARKSGGKVMSHCWHGRNRSITLLVAYLMKYQGMSAMDAVELLQQTRPIADPYRDSLYKYGKHYLHLGKGSEELLELKDWWYENFDPTNQPTYQPT